MRIIWQNYFLETERKRTKDNSQDSFELIVFSNVREENRGGLEVEEIVVREKGGGEGKKKEKGNGVAKKRNSFTNHDYAAGIK